MTDTEGGGETEEPEGKPNMDSAELAEKSESDVVGRDDDMPAKELNDVDMSKAEPASGRWWATARCWVMSDESLLPKEQSEYMHE